MNVCVCMCVCIYTHTYIHTCMHACMHACIHTYIHTWMAPSHSEAGLYRQADRYIDRSIGKGSIDRSIVLLTDGSSPNHTSSTVSRGCDFYIATCCCYGCVFLAQSGAVDLDKTLKLRCEHPHNPRAPKHQNQAPTYHTLNGLGSMDFAGAHSAGSALQTTSSKAHTDLMIRCCPPIQTYP